MKTPAAQGITLSHISIAAARISFDERTSSPRNFTPNAT
jgi:hypothetical protein